MPIKFKFGDPSLLTLPPTYKIVRSSSYSFDIVEEGLTEFITLVLGLTGSNKYALYF